MHLGSRINLLIKYTNPGCVNEPVLDVGDSVFDVKTTMVYFPALELKYIENDDFVCGFVNDEKEISTKINGQTSMIRPNRVAIALETDPLGIQELLLQDQVRLLTWLETMSDNDSSPLKFCRVQFYIRLR